MKLKVLGSSSSGNCYILFTPTGSLLLDCGLPWKFIQKGLGFDLFSVDGCLITHAHKDHSKALQDIMNAGIDVYTSKGTIEALGMKEASHRLNILRAKTSVTIGNFTVLPFETQHDCIEPMGFLIQYRPTSEKLLYLTDSYYCKYRFKGLNYILIECNYCKDILDRNIEAGLIDEAMKRRLLESHFSLEHVKDFIKANDLSECRKIILIHLSEGNSDASRMIQEIYDLTGIETLVAQPGLEVDLELYPY